jgi:hypothetical protein
LFDNLKREGIDNLSISIILKFTFGKNEFERLNRAYRDLPEETLEDLVLSPVFTREKPQEVLEALGLDILETHARLESHYLFHQVDAACKTNPALKRIRDNYFERHHLWHLPSETNPQRIEHDVELLVEFMMKFGIPLTPQR